MPQSLKDFIDIAFKLAVLAAVACFLFLYAEGRSVGRFQYIANGEQEYIMDTVTGVIYQGGFSMNHITGKETLSSTGQKPR
ncbi:hypothetical protein GTA51_11025 [Desulfovibrio aerotolerans]|uniref:Uncharacterized protein n=1 Tax=Solidesulfovibrio aerotolerans TaxID=295255 RepID=A0A7C9N0Y9_9BACT|nr:hypothetical protein [Solidesulfovibrio aerotolerans]MYL83657.1 hypothetical protein [Solidesulfovibrio aerotolerans]